MQEFRKIIKTPPVILTKKDLEDLEQILTQNLPPPPKVAPFNFSLFAGDAQFQATSIIDLFAHNLPDVVDGLEFIIRGWTTTASIDRGISLELRRTYGQYQIHSSDEVWFNGKIQQINQFLQSKQPWYGRTRSQIARVLGVLQGIFISAAVYAIYQRQVVLTILTLITCGLLNRCFTAFQAGRLFPANQITLTPKASRLTKENIMLFCASLTAIGSIANAIVNFCRK
jgi:hypothetical protein